MKALSEVATNATSTGSDMKLSLFYFESDVLIDPEPHIVFKKIVLINIHKIGIILVDPSFLKKGVVCAGLFEDGDYHRVKLDKVKMGQIWVCFFNC